MKLKNQELHITIILNSLAIIESHYLELCNNYPRMGSLPLTNSQIILDIFKVLLRYV